MASPPTSAYDSILPTYDSTPREIGAGLNPLIAALRGMSTAPAKASGYTKVGTPWATNTPDTPYKQRFTASTVNRDPVPKKPDDITEPDPTPGTEGYFEDVIIEHMHPVREKSSVDNTYNESWVLADHDKSMYEKYKESEFLNDVRKVVKINA